MKRKYKLINKVEWYEIVVELDKIYWIADSVIIGDETFIVIDRIWLDL